MATGEKRDYTIFDSDLGHERKRSLLSILMVFCTLMLVSLGTTAWFQEHRLLAICDWVVALLYVGDMVYVRRGGNVRLAAWVGLTGLGLLFLFLLFNGGVDYTGFVWLATYPLLTIYLLGSVRGGALAGIVLLVFVVVRYGFPEVLAPGHPYTADFMLRFLASIGVIFFVAIYMELGWKEAQLLIKKKNELLHNLSHLDSLTGVYNRRHFDDELTKQWSLSDRSATPLGLLMVDVDHFKKYNDRYGHQAGDDALIAIAEAIGSRACRRTDTVARYGGEEFAVILPASDLTGSLTVTRRILKRIHDMRIRHADGEEGRLSASIGVACQDGKHRDESAESFLKRADEALYQAKKKGRNTFATE